MPRRATTTTKKTTAKAETPSDEALLQALGIECKRLIRTESGLTISTPEHTVLHGKERVQNGCVSFNIPVFMPFQPTFFHIDYSVSARVTEVWIGDRLVFKEPITGIEADVLFDHLQNDAKHVVKPGQWITVRAQCSPESWLNLYVLGKVMPALQRTG